MVAFITLFRKVKSSEGVESNESVEMPAVDANRTIRAFPEEWANRAWPLKDAKADADAAAAKAKAEADAKAKADADAHGRKS